MNIAAGRIAYRSLKVATVLSLLYTFSLLAFTDFARQAEGSVAVLGTATMVPTWLEPLSFFVGSFLALSATLSGFRCDDDDREDQLGPSLSLLGMLGLCGVLVCALGGFCGDFTLAAAPVGAVAWILGIAGAFLE